MAHINLLPWREERHKQRERSFYAKLGMAFVFGLVVVIIWASWEGARIGNQNDRNAYLKSQIHQVDVKIAKIKSLEKVRSQLLARKKIIEQLQSNRSQMVHLFDELVKTIPDSVRLTRMNEQDEQVGPEHTLVKHLTLEGVAQSNTSVADYMSNLEASPWFASPTLKKTENRHDGTRMPYSFGLSVTLSTPTEKELEAAEEEGQGSHSEMAPAASVARPGAIGTDGVGEPVAPATATTPGVDEVTPAQPGVSGGKS